ncbi:MAG: ribonuclease III [Alphaproteobacteria bacterium]
MTPRKKDDSRKALEARAHDAAAALQARLGHRFAEPALLGRALTHPSADGTPARNYQRLEFLGDRVLGLVAARLVFERFPAEPEGALARRFNELVRAETLTLIGRGLGLGEALVLGASEEEGGGRDKPANLANALEAVIAALYLDGGLDAAERFIRRHLEPLIDDAEPPPKDAKTALQEWAQARKLGRPSYRTVAVSGEAHAPSFEIEVEIEGAAPVRASGASKREAEQAAAQALLDRLRRAPHG